LQTKACIRWLPSLFSSPFCPKPYSILLIEGHLPIGKFYAVNAASALEYKIDSDDFGPDNVMIYCVMTDWNGMLPDCMVRRRISPVSKRLTKNYVTLLNNYVHVLARHPYTFVKK
jgi:hypothetical protein